MVFVVKVSEMRRKRIQELEAQIQNLRNSQTPNIIIHSLLLQFYLGEHDEAVPRL